MNKAIHAVIAAILLQSVPATAQPTIRGAVEPLSNEDSRTATQAENSLVDLIYAAMDGRVDYGRIQADILPAVKRAQPQVSAKLRRLGEPMEITHRGVRKIGKDRLHSFDIQHVYGRSKWAISLGSDGRISNINYKIR